MVMASMDTNESVLMLYEKHAGMKVRRLGAL